MRNVLARGVLLGALLLGGALQANAAPPSWISTSIEARKQAISERIEAAKERVCDRLAAVRDRTGHNRPLPPFCAGNGGGDDDDDDGEVSLTLNASDTSVEEGDTVTLTWDSTNAESCTASNGWTGSKSLDGSQAVTPATTTTYTLTCANDDDSETKSVTVTTTPPSGDDDDDDSAPGLSFTANPTSIDEGASSTLTWDSTDADLCVASNGWSGTKSVDGTQVVTPATTTTYTIACGNENGTTTDSETVNVSPASGDDDDDDLPELTFTGNPTTIDDDATSTLTWDSTNADLCLASGGWGGSKALDGSQVVSPNSNTTYTLNCSNENGTTTKNVTITVVDIDLPLLTFTATPSTIDEGASSTLNWNSTDADLCVASGGWSGTKTEDGSQSVSPTATTTYVLSCGNENGTTTASTTIGVILADEEGDPPLLSFTASPTTIDEGASSTLTWDSTDADLCLASGGWSGAKSVDGSQSVAPGTTTTYTLACSNENGTTTDSETVTVTEEGTSSPARLVISEVFYDPITSTSSSNQGTESANEWVEIHNAGGTAVNMADWYLEDASTVIEFFGTTTIPAGGYLIMTNSTTTDGFWNWPEDTVVVYLGNPIGNGLGNTGDALYLKSPDDEFIDAVSWGSDTSGVNPSVTDAPEGHSIARSNPDGADTNTNADWVDDATPNPGE